MVAYASAGELRVERDDGTRRSAAIAGPLTGPVGLGVDATGDRIAVATGEKLWVHAGERPARALEGGLFRSNRLVFGPDWLMAHESPGTLLVWDLSTGTRLGVFRPADAVETGEINMFVGKDFVVTVRHGQGIDLAASRRDR